MEAEVKFLSILSTISFHLLTDYKLFFSFRNGHNERITITLPASSTIHRARTKKEQKCETRQESIELWNDLASNSIKKY